MFMLTLKDTLEQSYTLAQGAGDVDLCIALAWYSNQIDNGGISIRTPRHNRKSTLRRLTDGQVRELRDLHKRGYSIIQLGDKFNMSPSAIYQIVSRATYKEVE